MALCRAFGLPRETARVWRDLPDAPPYAEDPDDEDEEDDEDEYDPPALSSA